MFLVGDSWLAIYVHCSRIDQNSIFAKANGLMRRFASAFCFIQLINFLYEGIRSKKRNVKIPSSFREASDPSSSGERNRAFGAIGTVDADLI